MGNCISKINKDLIFVYEKQRITFLSKGVLRRVRCMGTKETYTGAYSLMVFRNNNLKSVKNWDLVQRPLKQMCLV